MKTYFIVNPASGKNDSTEEIAAVLKNSGLDYEIYTTTAPCDGTEFVRRICNESKGTPVRFCACGGDGTLNEIVNGAAEYDFAEVTVYPCGSGNDFVKYYGKERFMNIKALATAPAKPIDIIRVNDMYSINIVNFGFDTVVAKTMEKVRKKAIIGGNNAYTTGVVKAVISGMKTKGTVYADGKAVNKNNVFTLCTVANGKYVGGKFQCAPRSVNDDGLLELCLVKKISRFTLIRLIGAYEKGQHLNDRRFDKIIHYLRCKKVEIKATKGFAVSVDGEIADGESFTIEILHNKIKFAIPDNNTELQKK